MTYIDWLGASGTVFRYHAVDLTKPIPPMRANYVFAKQLANGNYMPLYFGQTSNAHTRLTPEHEHWAAAVREGASLWAHATLSEELERCVEERDLIEKWQPPLNTQHRKTL